MITALTLHEVLDQSLKINSAVPGKKLDEEHSKVLGMAYHIRGECPGGKQEKRVNKTDN